MIYFRLCSIGLFFLISFTGAVAEDANELVIKKPPQVIADWYKPNNKRQVWLHTMFRLRRELLAIADYSAGIRTDQTINTVATKKELLAKWFASFKKDYSSISTMVPQWEGFVESDLVKQLELAINQQKYTQVSKLITKLNNSCSDCHSDYQAITRLIYRTADFSKLKVQLDSTHKVTYSKHMDNLSNTVNRLKIALHDEFYSQAITYLQPLQLQLKQLAQGCGDCHNYPAKEQPQGKIDYIFASTDNTLDQLKQALQQKQNKQARISLGTFAVNVCAKCHAAHRTTADLKELLE